MTLQWITDLIWGRRRKEEEEEEETKKTSNKDNGTTRTLLRKQEEQHAELRCNKTNSLRPEIAQQKNKNQTKNRQNETQNKNTDKELQERGGEEQEAKLIWLRCWHNERGIRYTHIHRGASALKQRTMIARIARYTLIEERLWRTTNGQPEDQERRKECTRTPPSEPFLTFTKSNLADLY